MGTIGGGTRGRRIRADGTCPRANQDLQDSDLRVVEQAVIALGKLRANASLQSLYNLFQNLKTNITEYWHPEFYNRPERTIPEKIAIAIAQFTNGNSHSGIRLPWRFVTQDDDLHRAKYETEEDKPKLDHQVVQGLKNNELLQSAIAGQMERGSLKPWEEGKGVTLYPQLPRVPSEETNPLKGTSRDELILIKRTSSDPIVRLRAFSAYAEGIPPNDLRDDYSNLDPSPKVQFELHRLRLKGYPNDRWGAFMGLPHYDLMLADVLKDINPGLVNEVHPEALTFQISYKRDATLLFSSLFSQDYKVDRLRNVLLQQVEAGNRDKSVMGAVSSLAEYHQTHRITSAIRKVNNWEQQNWWSDAMEPMVRKRAWHIVPELFKKANDDRRSGNLQQVAIDHLCSMGIYQAARLLDGFPENYFNFILPARIGIELGDKTKNLIPQYRYDRPADSDSSEVINWYMAANLACETETEVPPHEWSFSVAKYINDVRRDEDWLGRGLRKWGKVGTMALFAEMTSLLSQQDLENLCWSLISTSTQRFSYDSFRPEDREAILRSFSQCE